MRIILDVETTTWNKGHPFDPRNFCVSYSVKFNNENHFRYYTDPDFVTFLRGVVSNATTIIGISIKFDVHWLWRLNVEIPTACRIWDCSLAEFILSGQQNGFISLNDALRSYGLPTKKDAVAEYWAAGINTQDIPVQILEEYNCWDVETTELLYMEQLRILSEKQQRLVYTEGQDLLTLAHAEQAGIKWDREGSGKRKMELAGELEGIERELCSYLPDGIPNPPGFNWDSGDQLSAFLYGGVIKYAYSIPEESIYKSGTNKGEAYTRNRWFTTDIQFPGRFKPIKGSEVEKTKKNPPEGVHFYQTDDPTLKQLSARRKEDKCILALLDDRAKKIKVVEMIESIEKKITEKNWENDFIHPQFNQNAVITGRLSSSAPNMQNTPPEVDKFLVSRYG